MCPTGRAPCGRGSGHSSELGGGIAEVRVSPFPPGQCPALQWFPLDQPTLGTPRKLSVSGLQQPLASPRDAAPPPPRTRNGSGFDGVLGSGEPWNMRRRGSETRPRIGSATRDSGGINGQVDEISEMKLENEADGVQGFDRADKPVILDKPSITQSPPQRDQQDDEAFQQTEAGHALGRNQLIDDNGQEHLLNVPSATMTSAESSTTAQSRVPNVTGTTDLGAIEWSYLDTQGIVQGGCLRSIRRLDS
jgi:PERQ amino acid-rich with GYF domain-containing protein